MAFPHHPALPSIAAVAIAVLLLPGAALAAERRPPRTPANLDNPAEACIAAPTRACIADLELRALEDNAAAIPVELTRDVFDSFAISLSASSSDLAFRKRVATFAERIGYSGNDFAAGVAALATDAADWDARIKAGDWRGALDAVPLRDHLGAYQWYPENAIPIARLAVMHGAGAAVAAYLADWEPKGADAERSRSVVARNAITTSLACQCADAVPFIRFLALDSDRQSAELAAAAVAGSSERINAVFRRYVADPAAKRPPRGVETGVLGSIVGEAFSLLPPGAPVRERLLDALPPWLSASEANLETVLGDAIVRGEAGIIQRILRHRIETDEAFATIIGPAATPDAMVKVLPMLPKADRYRAAAVAAESLVLAGRVPAAVKLIEAEGIVKGWKTATADDGNAAEIIVRALVVMRADPAALGLIKRMSPTLAASTRAEFDLRKGIRTLADTVEADPIGAMRAPDEDIESDIATMTSVVFSDHKRADALTAFAYYAHPVPGDRGAILMLEYAKSAAEPRTWGGLRP